MAVDVIMPQMGESIFEGTITKWLKKPGDRVEKDEPLFEISTDKVDAEIPAPVAGVLSEIKIPEGEAVQVNTVVAVIGGAATVPANSKAATKPSPQPKAETVQAPQASAPGTGAASNLRSSPLVRRIARENSVDLARVRGSGMEGRITKDDILGYLAEGRSAPAASFAPQEHATPAKMSGEVVPLTRMRAIIAQRMLESVQTSP